MDLQALLLTAGAAFAISALLGPICIPILHRLKFGQKIRDEGPQHHQAKSGTPTMGGIMIVVALILTLAKFLWSSPDILILLLATVAFGLVGFLDDFIKVVKKRNLGLTAKQKFGMQIVATVILYAVLWWHWHSTGEAFRVSIPFTDVSFNLSGYYIFFLLLILLAATNAVNLTDGLDGLLSGSAGIVFAAYGYYAFLHTEYDVSLFCAAMVGALVGFLLFNRHPAKVFMGDTGSLAIGGALAMVAVLTHSEIALLLFGLIFVIETLSVIIQVFAFQTFGRRVFRMSPLHHHFELSGWTEWGVVLAFWLFSFLSAFGTLALFAH